MCSSTKSCSIATAADITHENDEKVCLFECGFSCAQFIEKFQFGKIEMRIYVEFIEKNKSNGRGWKIFAQIYDIQLRALWV